MRKKSENKRLFIKDLLTQPSFQISLLIIILFSLYCITLNTVPFHPDEATYLFKSTDVKSIIANPFSLSFHKQDNITPKIHYRLIDPPMNSLLIGLATQISQKHTIFSDWDWTSSWEANLHAGNLPETQSVLIARISLLLFFPFSCFFLYQMVSKLIHHQAGLLAVLFYALNPLILLHSRRAMSEGIFLFFVCFMLWLILDQKKHIYGVPIVFTFCLNSKHTALFLLPMYFLYYFFMAYQQKKAFWIKAASSFIGIPLILTYLLNPVAWQDPVNTLQAALHERTELTRSTQAFLTKYYPEKIQPSTLVRFILINYHTFFEPVALDDVGNYRIEQQTSFDRYTSIPLQHSKRSLLLGTLQIIALGSTILFQLLTLWKKRTQLSFDFKRWMLFYTGLTGCLIGLSLLSTIYQRYVVILLPFVSLLNAYFVSLSLQTIRKKNRL